MSLTNTKEQNLRSTQTKVTTAANTIQNEILNPSSIRSQFSSEEQDVLKEAVQILLGFKDKVKHNKEKYIRAKNNAKRIEEDVRIANTRRVKQVVNSMPVNVCMELSVLSHYGYEELAEESYVNGYATELLQEARTDPEKLNRLWIHAKEVVVDLLIRMLPNQKYRSGFDDATSEWNDFLHAPKVSTTEFITEIVKKHMIHRTIKRKENIAYVEESVRLINLVRSVNQKIKNINQESDS